MSFQVLHYVLFHGRKLLSQGELPSSTKSTCRATDRHFSQETPKTSTFAKGFATIHNRVHAREQKVPEPRASDCFHETEQCQRRVDCIHERRAMGTSDILQETNIMNHQPLNTNYVPEPAMAKRRRPTRISAEGEDLERIEHTVKRQRRKGVSFATTPEVHLLENPLKTFNDYNENDIWYSVSSNALFSRAHKFLRYWCKLKMTNSKLLLVSTLTWPTETGLRRLFD